jgi:hypothetical protein
MLMEHQIDERRRLVLVKLAGDVRGRAFGKWLSGVFDARPELVGYDFILDMLDYAGDIVAADVEPIAGTYGRLARPIGWRPRSAFLTADPYFEHWAAALDHQFADRQHRVFAKPTPALKWLAEKRR